MQQNQVLRKLEKIRATIQAAVLALKLSTLNLSGAGRLQAGSALGT